MREENYRNKINDAKIEEVIMPIFNFFEPFIEKESEKSKLKEKTNYSEEDSLYYKLLVEQSIDNKISKLRKILKSKEFVPMNSFVLSLQQNVVQFISNEKYRSRVKWKKILYSYINVTRNIITYSELQRIINEGLNDNQKIILAMSLIDIVNDNVKANEEIEKIYSLFEYNSDVIVFPIYGCTTDVFKTLLDKLPRIDMIHLAGHTVNNLKGSILLSFVDSRMTFMKFSKFISRHDFYCSVYNCCSTYEFVEDQQHLLRSEQSILHIGEVVSNIAYEFAKRFYLEISIGRDQDISWQNASLNCGESPLRYIRYCNI